MKGKGFQERAASRENIRLARDGEGNLPQVTLGPALAEELLAACGLDLKTVYQAANHKEKLQGKSLDLTRQDDRIHAADKVHHAKRRGNS